MIVSSFVRWESCGSSGWSHFPHSTVKRQCQDLDPRLSDSKSILTLLHHCLPERESVMPFLLLWPLGSGYIGRIFLSTTTLDYQILMQSLVDEICDFRAKANTKEREIWWLLANVQPAVLFPSSALDAKVSPAPGQMGPHPAEGGALTEEQPGDVEKRNAHIVLP